MSAQVIELPRDYLTRNKWVMVQTDPPLDPYRCDWIDPISGETCTIYRAKEIQAMREAEQVQQ
jgi:hypothetical protein